MDDTIEELYSKYTGSIEEALADDRYFQYMFEMVQASENKLHQTYRVLHKVVDESWLTVVEDGIEAIFNIVDKPRRFITTSEEVVPVALAKKITADSVRHLSQNTQFIATNAAGEMHPTKILNVTTEESYDLYENRFVYHLIQRLFAFVDKRTDVIFWSTGDETCNIMSMESKIDDAYEEISYKVEMTIKNKESLVENDADNMNVFKRIDRVRRMSRVLRSSSFCEIMNGCARVYSPIQRTNLMMKDPDYRRCYKLWQFIESYDEVGYSIEEQDSAMEFDEEYLLQMYINMITNYTVFKSLLESDPRKMWEINTEKKEPVKPVFVKEIREEIVEDRNIPDVEIRQVFVEEVTQAQLDAEAALEEQVQVNKELEQSLSEMQFSMSDLQWQIDSMSEQMQDMSAQLSDVQAEKADYEAALEEEQNQHQETKTKAAEELAEVKAACEAEVATVRKAADDEVLAAKSEADRLVAETKAQAEAEVAEIKTASEEELARTRKVAADEISQIKADAEAEVAAARKAAADEIAQTKADAEEQLAAVKAKMQAEIDEINRTLDAARARAAEELAGVKAACDAELTAVRKTTDEEILATKTAAESRIAEIKADAESQIAGARADAESQIASARADAEAEVAAARKAAADDIAATKADAESQILSAKADAESQIASVRADAAERIETAEKNAAREIAATKSDAAERIETTEKNAAQEIAATKAAAADEIESVRKEAAAEIGYAKAQAEEEIARAQEDAANTKKTALEAVAKAQAEVEKASKREQKAIARAEANTLSHYIVNALKERKERKDSDRQGQEDISDKKSGDAEQDDK